MNVRTASLRQAYTLAAVGVPMLVVYGMAQTFLGLVLIRSQPELKLVTEPYLLLLGLVLHVQWRKVSLTFQANSLRRPWWIALADCLSFVITFWALSVLAEAFFHEAKLL